MNGYPVDLYTESYPPSVLSRAVTAGPDLSPAQPKRRGRKPKQLTTQQDGGEEVSTPNANGAPTWQDHLHEQSYGTPEEPEAEPESPSEPEPESSATA